MVYYCCTVGFKHINCFKEADSTTLVVFYLKHEQRRKPKNAAVALCKPTQHTMSKKEIAELEKPREGDKKEQSHWTIEEHWEYCSKLQDQKESQVLSHHDLDMTHSLWCHDSHKTEWLKIILLWNVYQNWVHCYNVMETSIKGRFAERFIRWYNCGYNKSMGVEKAYEVSLNKHSPSSENSFLPLSYKILSHGRHWAQQNLAV